MSLYLIRLISPLAEYLLIGLFSNALFPGGGLYASLMEKSLCLLLMERLYRRDNQIITWEPVRKDRLFFPAAAFIGFSACLFINCFFEVTGLNGALAADAAASTVLYHQSLPLEILLFLFLAPLSEEFLFRGIFYRRLRTLCRPVPAVLTGALVFALFHGNLLQGLYAFLLGILLLYVYETSHSLLAPIVLHTAANLASLVMTEVPALHRFCADYTVLILAVSGVCTAAGLALVMRNQKKTRLYLDK